MYGGPGRAAVEYECVRPMLCPFSDRGLRKPEIPGDTPEDCGAPPPEAKPVVLDHCPPWCVVRASISLYLLSGIVKGLRCLAVLCILAGVSSLAMGESAARSGGVLGPPILESSDLS